MSRGANTTTTMELRRALRVDRPTVGVEMHGVGWVKKRWTGGVVERGTGLDEEHEQGVKTPGEAEARNRQSGRNLKLSLRGSVEKQAQHGPNWLNKPRDGSDEDRLTRPRSDQ